MNNHYWIAKAYNGLKENGLPVDPDFLSMAEQIPDLPLLELVELAPADTQRIRDEDITGRYYDLMFDLSGGTRQFGPCERKMNFGVIGEPKSTLEISLGADWFSTKHVREEKPFRIDRIVMCHYRPEEGIFPAESYFGKDFVLSFAPTRLLASSGEARDAFLVSRDPEATLKGIIDLITKIYRNKA